MTNEKFTEQVTTLAKFLQTYCADKHALAPKREINLELTYKGKNLNDSVRTQLCAECEQLFFYAHERLLACSHDIKPSCRKCPHPYYKKPRWTQMAKIMRYSGMKLGLVKLKKIFTFSKTAEQGWVCGLNLMCFGSNLQNVLRRMREIFLKSKPQTRAIR